MQENLPAFLSGQTLTIDLTHHQIQDVAHKKNMSALAYTQQHVILAADEGATLWVARLDGQTLTLLPYTLELAPDTHELDIEAMHWHNGQLIVLGSHSLKRKKVKPTLSYEENHQRLLNVVEDKKRQQLLMIELPWFEKNNPADKNPFSEYHVTYKKSLYKTLKKDALLSRFMDIPSKENGIDMEGVASDNKHIYIGFRSPVLRQNFVPILVMEPSDDKHPTYQLRFIQCGGHGVRDLTITHDGALVLSGPSNDSPGEYRIYWWNKQDTIPGINRPTNQLICLARIQADKHSKAEALTILEETPSSYQVLIAFDGPAYGKPMLFTLPKP